VPGTAGGAAYQLGVRGLTQGLTETTIRIGVPVIANAEAVVGLLGAADINPGNNRLETEALVAEINGRGGIHGRLIEPIYYDVDFGNPTNVDANVLAACSYFADDAQVFAVLMIINPPPAFVSCFAQEGVILLNGSLFPGDDVLIAQASPWYYMPGLVSLSRIWEPMLDEAGAYGHIAAGDKVGGCALDQPVFTRTAEQIVIPALEARGYAVAAYERVATEASIQNAVLRFRQAGVTHVIFVQASGIADLLFMRQAEAQQFRPRYIVNSYDVIGYIGEGNVADAQVAGVMGIGWQFLADVDASQFPETPAETRCLDILERGGEPSTSRQSNLTATFMCDLVWSFEAIANAAGPQLSSASFRAGYFSLGRSYPTVSTAAVDFSSRIDGVAGYRVVAYDTGCGCLRYQSEVRSFP
jgi:ABC-type branched-subunit amino acid transport system substrate-binding protein